MLTKISKFNLYFVLLSSSPSIPTQGIIHTIIGRNVQQRNRKEIKKIGTRIEIEW